MESWVGLGGKEGRTNIRISAKPGIEPGTLWSKGRDLTNCANHARPSYAHGLPIYTNKCPWFTRIYTNKLMPTVYQYTLGDGLNAHLSWICRRYFYHQYFIFTKTKAWMFSKPHRGIHRWSRNTGRRWQVLSQVPILSTLTFWELAEDMISAGLIKISMSLSLAPKICCSFFEPPPDGERPRGTGDDEPLGLLVIFLEFLLQERILQIETTVCSTTRDKRKAFDFLPWQALACTYSKIYMYLSAPRSVLQCQLLKPS